MGMVPLVAQAPLLARDSGKILAPFRVMVKPRGSKMSIPKSTSYMVMYCDDLFVELSFRDPHTASVPSTMSPMVLPFCLSQLCLRQRVAVFLFT